MKKNLTYYFSLVLLSVSFISSCTLYEDITFHADGKITYSITLDMEEMMGMIPSLSNKDSLENNISSDSIISFAEMLAEKEGKREHTDEEKQLIFAIKPFSVRQVENYEDNVFTSSIYGTFDNDKQLNEALFAMNKLIRFADNGRKYVSVFFDAPEYVSQYSWDGTTMMRYTIKNPLFNGDENIEEREYSEELISEIDHSFGGMVKASKMRIKYHFPYRVEKINNTEATFSQDGKTVISDHKATVFTDSPQDADISITVTKP